MLGCLAISKDGATVRNIVLDSSCSVVSSFSGNSDDANVGGTVGYCHGTCTIERVVNMASAAFTGENNWQ